MPHTHPPHRTASAVDLRKDEEVPALQDNVKLLFEMAASRYPHIEWYLPFYHEWIAILHKLVALIALGFSAVFDQVGSRNHTRGQHVSLSPQA